jgi:hypothetical protein
MVVPYGASNLESAERVTHVMRKTENELRRLQVAGFYLDVDLGTPANTLDEVEKKIAEKMGFRASTDDRYKLLEMHVDLDLPGYEDKDEETGELTGIALPYVVTLEKGSTTILSIRRNWDPKDETRQKRQHFVHYGYVPGFGFYYFVRHYWPRWQWWALASVLLLGLVFGIGQQLRGAHFVSHDVWTLGLCWFIATTLALWWRRSMPLTTGTDG